MLSTVIVKKPTNVTLTGGLVTPRDGEPQSNDIHRSAVLFSNSQNDVLSNTSDSTLGIANSWSIGIYHVSTNTSQTQDLFALQNSAATSLNRIEVTQQAGSSIRIILYNSAGTIFKDYTFSRQTLWSLWVWTWDGTDLKGYRNGVEQTPTATTVDNAGTMTDTARSVYLGNDRDGSTGIDGTIQQFELWNSVLTKNETVSLYNGGFGASVDLQTNFEFYNSSSSLQHWWRLGKIATLISIGVDFQGSLDLSA